jgi:hypothetical protein
MRLRARPGQPSCSYVKLRYILSVLLDPDRQAQMVAGQLKMVGERNSLMKNES